MVTPTPGAYVAEKILVLDDTDSMIKYTGKWTTQSGTRFSNGIAFGDTSRGASKKDDGLTLEFTGIWISLTISTGI